MKKVMHVSPETRTDSLPIFYKTLVIIIYVILPSCLENGIIGSQMGTTYQQKPLTKYT